MRVLLLTPYAPDLTQPHAAADTIARLVPRLAEKTELFVYSPQHRPATAPAKVQDLNYTLLRSSVPGAPGRWDRFGRRPAWLRQAWPRQATLEAAELVGRLRPDVVHAEYLQSAETLTNRRNSVLGLHDITESVMRESYRAADGGVERAYRLAELLRTRHFERGAIRRAGAVLTLADADFDTASRYNPNTVLARPGVDLGEVCWSPPRDSSRPRLVFAGAMWRRANVLVVQHLAREVMPIVWRTLPNAELRIVGADPSPDVLALADLDNRLVVTGTVPDLRTEMLAAHAVVVPSIIGGGVLMKVVHAMALGCPVVTSPGPAASVRGDATNLFIASTPEQIAHAVGVVVGSPDEAVTRGRRARAHIDRTFRWDDTVLGYLDAYATASAR
ncbi:glycosyltransferase family 4 protein [Micromonospora sp. NPDC050417]|uniref:glycosyltransferase family 4 protein n=1 Tax=Micromonospora sp. NPDC050417 TaxID=3364280 RepID=UPI00378FA542